MKDYRSGFSTILFVIVIVAIAVTAGYFAAVKNRRPVAIQMVPMPIIRTPTSTSAAPPSPASLEPFRNPLSSSTPTSNEKTSSWRIYRNKRYGFELMYPPNWIVHGETEVKLTPLTRKGHSFLYVPFGPSSGFHIGVQLVCNDFNFLGNKNMAGKGKDLSLTIGGEEIRISGEDPTPRSPGEEGEPFGFRVSYCITSTSATTCVVFSGFNTPINQTDKHFMESLHFSKSLDSLANNCP